MLNWLNKIKAFTWYSNYLEPLKTSFAWLIKTISSQEYQALSLSCWISDAGPAWVRGGILEKCSPECDNTITARAGGFYSRCRWTWGDASAASCHCGSSCRNPLPLVSSLPTQLAERQTLSRCSSTTLQHSGSLCWPSRLQVGTHTDLSVSTLVGRVN